MKLKQRPEDFRVREILAAAPAGRGPFAIYRLRKAHIGTLEAIGAISRALNVPRRAIGVGGLKDTHADAEQFVSIRGGPARGLEDRGFTLEFAGRDDRPMAPARIAGNEFEITVRDLEPAEAERFRRELGEIAAHGIPNYFDAQRFGSVVDGEFVGEKLVAGDFEGAMKLALGPRVRARWARWDELMRDLPRSPERSLVNFLRDHPTDFAGAFDRIEKRLRFLYLSAYQSHLWNASLSDTLRRIISADRLFERKIGPGRFEFYRTLEPGERGALGRLPLSRPKLKKIRRAWFGKGERDAIVVPRSLSAVRDEADALNAGRRAVTISCGMPRGTYATLIVRRVFGTWKRGVSLD